MTTKNKNRKSENKSLAEGYRENRSLISSDYEIDTLYICEELFIGENNYDLISLFNKKNVLYDMKTFLPSPGVYVVQLSSGRSEKTSTVTPLFFLTHGVITLGRNGLRSFEKFRRLSIWKTRLEVQGPTYCPATPDLVLGGARLSVS